MKLQTILFDLDGTLLDTLEDLAAAVNQALAEHGLAPLAVDDYRLLAGAGARNLMKRAFLAATGEPLAEAQQAKADSLLDAFNRAYDHSWADHTRPYDGIPGLLEQLRTAGIQLAVISNKPDVFTRRVISHFFAADVFCAVTGKLDEWPIKPDPALTLEICRQIGADPDTTAMIGDSGSDMITAVNAGLLPIGVLWGFRDEAELLEGGARHLASTPQDLYNIIAGR